MHWACGKILILLLFYGLMAGSLWFAVANWREDSAQRTGAKLWLWATRVAIGCMWFQGTLWKLPFGHENGLITGRNRWPAGPPSRFTAISSPT